MSPNSINQFPVEYILMNLDRIPLTLLIVGLVEFLLLHIFLDRKRLYSFFLRLKSSIQSQIVTGSEDQAAKKVGNVDLSTKKEMTVQQSVRGGDVELVFRSLGMFSNSEKLPASFDADEILDVFEEENPRLEEVKEAFDVFDGNRDGFIDAKELQNILCALGLKEGSEMENCRRMIALFDENSDGRIDFDEFLKFM